MAKIHYSDFVEGLDAAATLDGTELIAVIQDGEPVQTTAQDIADLGGGGASYLVYTALLTQSGTDAPVATVLENTLGGTVVWTRNDTGIYTGTLAGAFTENKTFCFATGSGLAINPIGPNDINSVSLINLQMLPSVEPADEITASVEIRVYP